MAILAVAGCAASVPTPSPVPQGASAPAAAAVTPAVAISATATAQPTARPVDTPVATTSPSTAAPSATSEPMPGSQIANPASTNCIEKGGKLEIVKGDGGEYGVCTFPDGSKCEEWAFFRGECQIGQTKDMPKVSAATPPPITTPAKSAATCEQLGGTTSTIKGPDREVTMCILPDGTTCEAGAVASGQCKPGQSTTANMPNPAAKLCVESGGKSDVVDKGTAGEYGACTFKDGTVCDEWAFFRGDCGPGKPASTPAK